MEYLKAASADLEVVSVEKIAAYQAADVIVIAVADGASVKAEAEFGYLAFATVGLDDQGSEKASDFADDCDSEPAAGADFGRDFSEADGLQEIVAAAEHSGLGWDSVTAKSGTELGLQVNFDQPNFVLVVEQHQSTAVAAE